MADQAQRIVFLLKKLQMGNKYTTSEAYEMICKEFGPHSLRTVQRDMLLLQKCEPTVNATRVGKEHLWFIPKEIRKAEAMMRIDNNEILSFYILKAHLKTFSGTVIEDDINRLVDKLEKFAPEEIYAPESLFWDQNIGYFDYSKYNDKLIDIIDAIVYKKWINIDYNTSSKGIINKILLNLRCLFTYSGALYAVAYVPKHDSHIALALHNIVKMEEVQNYKKKLPEFSFKEWTKNRFGVFYGEPKRIVLTVKPEFKHYFINRKWHQTQNIIEEEDGSLTMELKVPIGPDFISWVMSWSSAIIIKKPKELRKAIIEKLERALIDYEYKEIEGNEK
ncbi:MAG: WYL domain-containing protein [Bacteroidota bacterium]